MPLPYSPSSFEVSLGIGTAFSGLGLTLIWARLFGWIRLRLLYMPTTWVSSCLSVLRGGTFLLFRGDGLFPG